MRSHAFCYFRSIISIECSINICTYLIRIFVVIGIEQLRTLVDVFASLNGMDTLITSAIREFIAEETFFGIFFSAPDHNHLLRICQNKIKQLFSLYIQQRFQKLGFCLCWNLLFIFKKYVMCLNSIIRRFLKQRYIIRILQPFPYMGHIFSCRSFDAIDRNINDCSEIGIDRFFSIGCKIVVSTAQEQYDGIRIGCHKSISA